MKMRKCASYIIFTLLLAAIACACSDNIDIRQGYEFKVAHLPVPKRLKVGEVAEIRCQLERSGRYENARYYLRFFQSDGRGTLSIDDGRVFLPNDTYEITKESFRLYYQSETEDQAVIDIVFFDSFGYEYPLSFSFQNDNSGGAE